MTERDQSVMYPVNGEPVRLERLPAFADYPIPEDQPADVATGLVSLRYIGSAIRRGARLWCALALVGLVAGVGFFVLDPPAYKAQTSVLITYGLGENPSQEVFDDQAIAQSHTVAGLAMAKLGIHESLGKFAGSYSVAVLTERVLQFTVSATSSSSAVSRANALATSFLQFMATQQLRTQQTVVQSLQQQLPRDTQAIATLDSQIAKVKAEPITPNQQAELKFIQAEQAQATTTLQTLQQTIAGDQVGSQTLPAIKGSVVLDPAAAAPYSKLKHMITYGAYGLVGGLLLGMGIVVISALVSDRLRRRDDIARAIGAPVKLSVGLVRLSRKLPPTRRGIEAADDPNVKPVVALLRDAVSTKDRRLSLAVVATDDADVAPLSVAALAMSFAREGRKVMLADLLSGAPAGRLLGRSSPGVGIVRSQDTSLMLFVPDKDEIAPCVPSGHGSAPAGRSRFDDQLSSAYASVDVLLTLTALDPGYGAEHLATWADRAVLIVTAGRSSWGKLQATGDMLRVAGVSLVSTVLVGADKSDDSLGVASDSAATLSAGRLS
jgi:capsular polysaccharide biosynthesis protein